MQNFIFLAVPLLVWAFYRLNLPNIQWELDFDQAHGTFSLLIDRYLFIARMMIAVDLLAALVGKWNQASRDVEVCCLVGAAYAFLFSVWITTMFESYLHARYPRNGSAGTSPYTTSKLALTKALGISAVVFSLIGVAMAVLG